jgi:hypothetical protein
MKKIALIIRGSLLHILILLTITNIFAQNVGINATGNAPNAAAMLDIDASPTNNKGLLIPRVALTATNSNSPVGAGVVTSLLVYNTVTAGTSPNNVYPGFYYWNGSSWISLSGFSGGNVWSLTGNAGTTIANNFIGTMDAQPLEFKVNNNISGYIDYNNTGNTGFGYLTLSSNIGTGNTTFGFKALMANTSGLKNTAFGYQALISNLTGSNNVAIGYNALSKYLHNKNTAVGDSALANNTDNGSGGDAQNTAIGYAALTTNTTGFSNTAVGYEALYLNSTGNYNNANGYYAMASNTTGAWNSANGAWALYSNTTGNFNAAMGAQALLENTTGSNNTAVGFDALEYNTTGSFNSANGFYSLRYDSTGAYNVGSGFQSLYSNKTGSHNVAIGYNTLFNYMYSGNTAIGDNALSVNTDNGSGADAQNTAIGYQSMTSTTTGFRNAAIGYQSLFNNTTGSNNTAIGYGADVGSANLVNATAIGNTAIASTSNSVTIGNSSISSIKGQVGFTTFSDARVKNNIKANVPGLAFINKLKPVSYNYDVNKENELLGIKNDTVNWKGKYDIEKITFSGFLAQDVDSAAKAVSYNFSGIDKTSALWGLRYSEFVPSLVKAIQEQQQQIDELKKLVDQLSKR